MTDKIIIQKTKEYVRQSFKGAPPCHDWWHSWRVWRLAKRIAKKEGGNLFVIELAALLHDIADWKFHGGDTKVGAGRAKQWLKSLKIDKGIVNHVYEIINNVSFKGAGVKSKMRTKEGMIVQDADRLDVLGAIGVARVFSYGGQVGRAIYNPGIKPKLHRTFKEYKERETTGINHFYEKILLLKDLMNTKTAKNIARKRQQFAKQFLKEFFKEWQIKD